MPFLNPITNTPRRRERVIKTYDLEWIPGTYEVTLVGVRDETGRYTAYKSVDDFLNGQLTQKNHGAYFYAHAGGLADINVMLSRISENPSYSVTAVFSGSSAVIVEIRRGRNKWVFVDSLFTLPSSLDKIAKTLKMQKGEVKFGTANRKELIEYNEQDNVILGTALDRFQSEILELGSELRSTAASTAMRLLQRVFLGGFGAHPELREGFRTFSWLNTIMRPAYSGGRVENYRSTPVGAGRYYDVRSCYPYAMTMPLPRRYLGRGRKLPKGDELYIADVTCTVPESETYPALPFRGKTGLYFPSGKRRSLVCGPELSYALESGRIELHQIHCVYLFEPFFDLREYAEHLFKLRSQRGEADAFLDALYKLLLNALYGKFGELSTKEQIIINPSPEIIAEERRHIAAEMALGKTEAEAKRMTMLHPGIFRRKLDAVVRHCHVPLAAYVTSYGRRTLLGYVHDVERAGGHVPYMDTDGFAVLGAELPTSKDLGGLKLEKTFTRAHFAACKQYDIELENGQHVTKLKGFSGFCACFKPLPREVGEVCPGCGFTRKGWKVGVNEKGEDEFVRMTPEMFRKLLEKHPSESYRMMRTKELARSGDLSARDVMVTKTVRLASTKRKFEADGSSRAWTVDELIKMKVA